VKELKMATIDVQYHIPQVAMVWSGITEIDADLDNKDAVVYPNSYYAQFLELGGEFISEEEQDEKFLKDNGGQVTRSQVVEMREYIDSALKRMYNRQYNWCGLDTHRWIADLFDSFYMEYMPLNETDTERFSELQTTDGLKKFWEAFFAEVVWPILSIHGNLTHTALHGTQDYLTLEEWWAELSLLTATVGGTSNHEDRNDALRPILMLQKEFQENVIQANSPGALQFQAKHLLGWCYLLALRDSWHGITYSPCEGCAVTDKPDHLKRETPSVGLPSKTFPNGRPIGHCGVYCAGKASEYKKAMKIVERDKANG